MTGMTESALTVGQVAERFAVTVRTLHHYDEVGLLRPTRRSAAGYRVYTDADIRKMGFPSWYATERRTEKERPSRMTSTAYSMGRSGLPARTK